MARRGLRRARVPRHHRGRRGRQCHKGVVQQPRHVPAAPSSRHLQVLRRLDWSGLRYPSLRAEPLRRQGKPRPLPHAEEGGHGRARDLLQGGPLPLGRWRQGRVRVRTWVRRRALRACPLPRAGRKLLGTRQVRHAQWRMHLRGRLGRPRLRPPCGGPRHRCRPPLPRFPLREAARRRAEPRRDRRGSRQGVRGGGRPPGHHPPEGARGRLRDHHRGGRPRARIGRGRRGCFSLAGQGGASPLLPPPPWRRRALRRRRRGKEAAPRRERHP
mmetsp:Transcript_23328/g.88490  ORF Transcript_23328/g.88490 Transcript_23328/m.88490 type:complete len:271 (+) Transcript_23328:1593-2405(+)